MMIAQMVVMMMLAIACRKGTNVVNVLLLGHINDEYPNGSNDDVGRCLFLVWSVHCGLTRCWVGVCRLYVVVMAPV